MICIDRAQLIEETTLPKLHYIRFEFIDQSYNGRNKSFVKWHFRIENSPFIIYQKGVLQPNFRLFNNYIITH